MMVLVLSGMQIERSGSLPRPLRIEFFVRGRGCVSHVSRSGQCMVCI